jgi:hypothetical protein
LKKKKKKKNCSNGRRKINVAMEEKTKDKGAIDL